VAFFAISCKRFPITFSSAESTPSTLEFTDNRFVVEGNYKYTYNNGHLAMADPMAAARNFLSNPSLSILSLTTFIGKPYSSPTCV